MKRTYIIPKTSIMYADVEQMLAASVTSSNYTNIDYGGVDHDGSIFPDVKENNNFWDDEW